MAIRWSGWPLDTLTTRSAASEIYQANRELLASPDLLPIGAELTDSRPHEFADDRSPIASFVRPPNRRDPHCRRRLLAGWCRCDRFLPRST